MLKLEICDIKERIADAVIICTLENDGLYIPSCISVNSFPYFAIDNVDVKINTLDGRKKNK